MDKEIRNDEIQENDIEENKFNPLSEEEANKFTVAYDDIREKIFNIINDVTTLSKEYSNDKDKLPILYLLTYTAAKLIEASNYEFDNSIIVEYDKEKEQFKVSSTEKVMFTRPDVDKIVESTIKQLFGEEILEAVKNAVSESTEEETADNNIEDVEEDSTTE